MFVVCVKICDSLWLIVRRKHCQNIYSAGSVVQGNGGMAIYLVEIVFSSEGHSSVTHKHWKSWFLMSMGSIMLMALWLCLISDPSAGYKYVKKEREGERREMCTPSHPHTLVFTHTGHWCVFHSWKPALVAPYQAQYLLVLPTWQWYSCIRMKCSCCDFRTFMKIS